MYFNLKQIVKGSYPATECTCPQPLKSVLHEYNCPVTLKCLDCGVRIDDKRCKHRAGCSALKK